MGITSSHFLLYLNHNFLVKRLISGLRQEMQKMSMEINLVMLESKATIEDCWDRSLCKCGNRKCSVSPGQDYVIQAWIPRGSSISKAWLTRDTGVAHTWLGHGWHVVQAWHTRGSLLGDTWWLPHGSRVVQEWLAHDTKDMPEFTTELFIE